MTTYATVDISRAHVVQVTVIAEPTLEGYQKYLDDLGDAFRQFDRFALIFDSGELTKFPSTYREMLARWMAETRDEFEDHWVSAAFVIDNRLLRGALMTLYWLNAPYYDYKLVATREEAWGYTIEKLRAAGVTLKAEAG